MIHSSSSFCAKERELFCKRENEKASFAAFRPWIRLEAPSNWITKVIVDFTFAAEKSGYLRQPYEFERVVLKALGSAKRDEIAEACLEQMSRDMPGATEPRLARKNNMLVLDGAPGTTRAAWHARNEIASTKTKQAEKGVDSHDSMGSSARNETASTKTKQAEKDVDSRSSILNQPILHVPESVGLLHVQKAAD